MKNRRGYTLIEVLVASGILVMGIAAAASLALTMVAREEANVRVARAINLHEQAGRLYQLGLNPDAIMAILPPEPNVISLTFTTNTLVVTNAGTVEIADCRMIFNAGPVATDTNASEPPRRTNDLRLVRPTIR